MPYVSLEKIIEDHKTEYYIALRTAQKDGKSPKAEMTRWIHFFIDVMVRQIDVLNGFLKSSSSIDSLLSKGQRQTLALFDKYSEISTKIVSEQLDIPSVTAKQILSRLLDLNLIERLGAGRSTRYRII